MNTASIKATALSVAETVTTWCLWFGKLAVAIGIAYASLRLLTFANIRIEGFPIWYPKVVAEPLQLAYIAGAIYLVSK